MGFSIWLALSLFYSEKSLQMFKLVLDIRLVLGRNLWVGGFSSITLQVRRLRLREVTCPCQSQRKLYHWEAAWLRWGRESPGSCNVFISCIHSPPQTLPMWGCLHGPGLGCLVSLSRHWHSAHSSSILMLPQTSRLLLIYASSPFSLSLVKLFLITYPSKWQWIHMKMKMEQDKRRFSRAWAWRHLATSLFAASRECL